MSDTSNTAPQEVVTSEELRQTVVTTDQQQAMPYTGFWYRVGAWLIDYIILQFAMILPIFIVVIAFIPGLIETAERMEAIENDGSLTEAQLQRLESEIAPQFIGQILLITTLTTILAMVIYWAYYAFFDSSKLQGTPGKLALQLKVTDLKGERIGLIRATGRVLGMFVSGFIFYIGYLFPLWTEKKQTLHDMMAGCVVLRKDKM